MTTTDMGIKYDAKLKEVKATINKLEKMSIDMTNVKKAVEQIEHRLSQKVQGSYDSFGHSSPVAFLYDSLTEDYGTAIKELDMINNALKREWESYYQIEHARRDIQVKMENVDEDTIQQIALSTKQVLESIKTSSTIDYSIEKDIVEKIYQMVYEVMQLELLYSNNSILFDAIKNDPIDTQFIVERMKEELKTLEGKEKKEIEKRLLELKQLGLAEKYLLDKNLLILLTLYKNPDLQNKSKERFIKDADELESVRKRKRKKEESTASSTQKIQELQKEKRKYSRKGLGKRIAILVNSLIIAAGITAGTWAGREITKGREYMTTTTTYDSSTGDFDVQQEYLKGKNDEVTLIEYSPWDSPGLFRSDYRRNKYSYSIQEREGITSIDQYLNQEEKPSFTTYEEKTSEKPEDYGYAENKYVVTEVKKDLEDSRKVVQPVWWTIVSILFSGGLITADFFLFKKLSKESLKVIKSRKKDIKRDLKEEQEENKEASDELEELVTLEEEKIKELRQQYASLPVVLKQLPEVEKVKQKVL